MTSIKLQIAFGTSNFFFFFICFVTQPFKDVLIVAHSLALNHIREKLIEEGVVFNVYSSLTFRSLATVFLLLVEGMLRFSSYYTTFSTYDFIFRLFPSDSCYHSNDNTKPVISTKVHYLEIGQTLSNETFRI